jgi:hypothetical protein
MFKSESLYRRLQELQGQKVSAAHPIQNSCCVRWGKKWNTALLWGKRPVSFGVDELSAEGFLCCQLSTATNWDVLWIHNTLSYCLCSVIFESLVIHRTALGDFEANEQRACRWWSCTMLQPSEKDTRRKCLPMKQFLTLWQLEFAFFSCAASKRVSHRA